MKQKSLIFLLKERFIATSHGNISCYKGNNADTHINFWQCTDHTISYKGTQKHQQFKEYLCLCNYRLDF